MSSTRDFEAMWRELAPVGRSATSGGYFRQPWTSAEAELRAWFRERAESRGLQVEEDPFGNLVAWWRPRRPGTSYGGGPIGATTYDVPGGRGRGWRDGAVLTGSHLDSVLDGGAYDGPLGVVSALAAVDLMRERGVEPARPLGIAVFAEEEGSRFGRACLGSRLATGQVAWAEVKGLADRDGTRLGDLVAGGDSRGGDSGGGDAGGGGPAPWLSDVGCFVELHVEQGRGLAQRDASVGAASAIWPHGRWRFDVKGRPDHAGTTRMEDRADPMLTYAMTALAANKQARLSGQRATFGRVEVAPGSTNAIPSRVTAWLDARAETDDLLAGLVEAITTHAEDRAGRDHTTVAVTAESVTGAVAFDDDLRERAAPGLPVLPTQAGHDAGILQAAGIASLMLFVRNPTGVSHSPYETAETVDCLAGVEALADVLTRLTAAGEEPQ